MAAADRDGIMDRVLAVVVVLNPVDRPVVAVGARRERDREGVAAVAAPIAKGVARLDGELGLLARDGRLEASAMHLAGCSCRLSCPKKWNGECQRLSPKATPIRPSVALAHLRRCKGPTHHPEEDERLPQEGRLWNCLSWQMQQRMRRLAVMLVVMRPTLRKAPTTARQRQEA